MKIRKTKDNEFKIYEDIILKPSDLSGIDTRIRKTLAEKVGLCVRDFGYIVEVMPNYKINSNIISRTCGDTIFNITYNAKFLKPEEGSVFISQITFIKEHMGIFSEYNKIKILVPATELVPLGWVYGDFSFTNGEEILNVGDLIQVQIRRVRFDDANYQCLGILIPY